MLESAGYEVLTAASGEEALRAFAPNEQPVHLMMTDVVMPGMNGRALADQFKETRPEIKVLYTSGYTDDAIVRHGVLDPGTAFVSKPFSAAGLLRKVRQVLDSKT
jgi:YesN/AraC family two-component response regulator